MPGLQQGTAGGAGLTQETPALVMQGVIGGFGWEGSLKPPSSSPLAGQGCHSLDQVAQGPILPGLGHSQGWGITEGESRGDGKRAVVVFVRIHVTSTWM